MKKTHISAQLVVIVGMMLLVGCVTSQDPEVPALTLKSLEQRSITLQKETLEDMSRKQIITSYREFLSTLPDYPLRAEAMRRLVDLAIEEKEFGSEDDIDTLDRNKMERQIDDRTPDSLDYKQTIRLYKSLLAAYPDYHGNDRVIYQLARIYDGMGNTRQSLAMLNSLVKDYPDSPLHSEAQFRRGEVLFTRKEYAHAEQAYKAIINRDSDSLFYEKAIFMHGWSLFKQGQYQRSVDSMFSFIDRKYGNQHQHSQVFSTGAKQMLDDAIRVSTLSFSYLGGATSIDTFFSRNGSRPYEDKLYRSLGDFYFEQGRVRDAADTYVHFINKYPMHREAPALQLKVITAYKKGGFLGHALNAKETFVARYGTDSHYWKNGSLETQQWLKGNLKRELLELARHFHAKGQKTGKPGHYNKAARWYRKSIQSFPGGPDNSSINFLLAESLFEAKKYASAVTEYERTAYQYPSYDKRAEAAYAALLAYGKHAKRLKGNHKNSWKRKQIASALRFSDNFPENSHVPAVLTKAAEDLFAMNQSEQASTVARRVLVLKPKARARQRRTAWIVIAHTEFDNKAFARSESSYQQALKLTPRTGAMYKTLRGRLASSIYKQGEQDRAVGDHRAAADHFLRLGVVVPESGIRATAEYDAAASLIVLKDWKGSRHVLESFQRKYPQHSLVGQVGEKLAVIYVESGNTLKAAMQFEIISKGSKDPQKRRDALWRSAELYEKGSKTSAAVKTFKRYVKEYPQPLEQAMEARYHLSELYQKTGQSGKRQYWLKQIAKADQRAGKARTDRTRFLAAQSVFSLAEPLYSDFKKIKLVRPLKRSLKKKKQKMQLALVAYGKAADYGVASITTACTYQIAEIYNVLGQDLLKSQRPKGLSTEEREQYDILLEEQAFPFEEKAIAAHETNVQRVAKGLYDKWVKSSFKRLSKLQPARYAKQERREVTIDAIR